MTFLREPPCERVLAAAAANDQDLHGEPSIVALRARMLQARMKVTWRIVTT